MKYAVIKVTDGNYNVHSEGHTTIKDARHSFYSYCAALSKDKECQTATVMIVDENLDKVEDCKAFFSNVVDATPSES